MLQNCTGEEGDHGDTNFTLTFDYEFVEDFRDSLHGVEEEEEEEGEDDIDGGENQPVVEAKTSTRQVFSESATHLLASQQEAGQQQRQAGQQQNGRHQQAAQGQAGHQPQARQPSGKKNNWGPKEYKRKNHVLTIMVSITNLCTMCRRLFYM